MPEIVCNLVWFLLAPKIENKPLPFQLLCKKKHTFSGVYNRVYVIHFQLKDNSVEFRFFWLVLQYQFLFRFDAVANINASPAERLILYLYVKWCTNKWQKKCNNKNKKHSSKMKVDGEEKREWKSIRNIASTTCNIFAELSIQASFASMSALFSTTTFRYFSMIFLSLSVHFFWISFFSRHFQKEHI